MRNYCESVFRINTKLDENYSPNAWMFMNLWNQIRVILALISTDSKTQAFLLDKFIVIVRIILCTSRCLLFRKEVYFLASSYRRLSLWELTVVRVESDGTLRIIIFESFWFREAERNLCWRIVCRILLDVLMRNYW